MADDFAAMGNFKGVMLCNRPVQIPGSLQTIVAPTQSSGGPSRPAFVSSVANVTALGLPPAKETRRLITRHQKDRTTDVTWRHKKWLSEFQDRRLELAQKMEERLLEEQERKTRFAERAQAMRDAIRGVKASDGDKESKIVAVGQLLNGSARSRPAYVPTEYVDVSQQYPKGAPLPSERVEAPSSEDTQSKSAAQVQPLPLQQPSQPSQPTQPSTSPASSTSKPAALAPAAKSARKAALSTAKPGWARTEHEDDAFLDAEADELLDFASSLDYERYIDDLEVREALKFVHDRVKGIEDKTAREEARKAEEAKLLATGEFEEAWIPDHSLPPDAEGNPQMRRVLRRVIRSKQAMTLADVEQNGDWKEGAHGDEALTERGQADAISRSILDSNRALRSIHSSASVRAKVEKEKESSAAAPNTNAGSNGTTVPSNFVGGAATLRRSQQHQNALKEEPTVRPPVITTIVEGDAKAEKALNPSNLPYLYRHPGI